MTEPPAPEMPRPRTPAALRSLFPAAARHVYLNAAASSPLALPVAAAAEAHLRDTVEHGDVGFGSWLRRRDALRARMARFLGAEADEVAFVPSTSFAFGVVGAMLVARGIEEVLTLEGEFPSTTLPLLHRGLTLRGVRRRPDGSYPLEDIEAALTPRTRAVALSVVQFSSGYRVDLEGLGRLCRDRGLVLALNAAQALGQVPLDVGAAGASFLAAPSHKWLMGGYGTGVLVVRRPFLDRDLPLAGWLSVAPEDLWQTWAGASRVDDAAGFTAKGARFRREASALEVGGTSWAGLFMVDAALDLLEGVGIARVEAHDLALQATLRRALRARGFVPSAPDDPARGSGICVVPVEGGAEPAVRALFTRGVVTTPRGGGVRISTHVFNDESDVERLLAAFDALGLRPG